MDDAAGSKEKSFAGAGVIPVKSLILHDILQLALLRGKRSEVRCGRQKDSAGVPSVAAAAAVMQNRRWSQ
jgi:hypothetical protein